jgi:phosphatidylserine/phosphatidylglycerophosphate/cardiolipin synthase-like enzyme
MNPAGADGDDISVLFLAEGEQTALDIATRLATFIAGARQSLDIAIYDFRLSPPLRAIVGDALTAAMARGVSIRIAYDADKPVVPDLLRGMDPASAGTGAFVQSLGVPWRRIGGQKLMHNKYLIRDAALPEATVWSGSLNFTDDAWTLQENNALTLRSSELAAAYAEDFAQLWEQESIENTGNFTPPDPILRYGGLPASVQIFFAPGRGETIDADIAAIVASAQRRVRICSMLLNSSALLNALTDILREGVVSVDGIYDRTQMASVLEQWQEVPHNHWKIPAIQNLVAAAQLVGKNSTPYSPTSRHDFMHDKILIVDDTVITGSYNFSHSAEMNAENILIITSAPLAATYSAMIDHLIAKYREA